jgi:enoyl-[acyl-carrier protein] reductase I
MTDLSDLKSSALAGRHGLVVGIANDQSIAYGCAEAFRVMGAELAVTYLNDKAKPYVLPLADRLAAKIVLPLEVRDSAQMDAVFAALERQWGRLDFVLHSIAFAPKGDLQGRVTDCSLEGFLTAMDISCHSFIRLAKRAEKLMHEGGTLVTMSYYGAHKVVPNYNLMGPVKAALESVVRYLAAELGPKGIRVHAVSPGPLKTRAASGIKSFDDLLEEAEHQAPRRALVDIYDVGIATASLCTPYTKLMTGGTIYVDGGVNILA